MIGITLLMLLDDVFALLFKFSSFTFDRKSCRGQNFRVFLEFWLRKFRKTLFNHKRQSLLGMTRFGTHHWSVNPTSHLKTGPYITTRSERCLSAMRPLDYTLQGVCLTALNVKYFGKNDPKNGKFSKMPSRMLFEGTWIHISWLNVVKSGRWEVIEKSPRLGNKNSGSDGLIRSRKFASDGPITPNATLSAYDRRTSTKFGPDWLRFAGVIPERLIFRTPKVTLKPAGFQPTKIHSKDSRD